eukprot:TRINITY_DN5152_c1_g1_i1.p1 TRINITY_DN5152_c1_g1~~TRINITY_DN5152_c1_g1_i1.p1  ORF type:complete len:672 (+),score=213.78 TRINITY_DN5152_c1_g1_i1:84-2018(+)
MASAAVPAKRRPLTCIILVAGHSSILESELRRDDPAHELGLGPLKKQPKALLPVVGRHGQRCSILDLWWNDLKERRQFSTVYLVTNADKYKYYERWATARDFPVDNIINDGSTTHEARLGACADFDLAVRTKNITGDVMVVSGDMLTSEDFDISGVIRFFQQHSGDLCIYYSMKHDEKTSTRGMLDIDPRTRRVTRFAEKPLTWDTRLASVVFYCFRQESMAHVRRYLAEHRGADQRSFGCFMEWLVPRSPVYGMKLPADFRLIGPDTTKKEYMQVAAGPSLVPAKKLTSEAIVRRAYARVGLMGNPSDGFFGKTISLSIANFWAEVTIQQSERLCLIPHPLNDPMQFGGLSDLFFISKKEGYVGGLRLMQATCKKFYEWCSANGVALTKRNFTLKYDTNIPRQVGLAGSSCIVTASLRALMAFYGLSDADIPKELQPNLVLSVESDELFITAGLQDRVVQTYQGLVYMDFDKTVMDEHGHGRYEQLDVSLAPPNLFLLYMRDPSDSGRIHANVKERWRDGDPQVVSGMKQFGGLTDQARDALLRRDYAKVGSLMDENFELRRRLYSDPAIGEGNLRMVELGRQFGAHMKFPGSGGAVVGYMPDPSRFEELQHAAQSAGFVFTHLIPKGADPLQPELPRPQARL